MFSQYVHLLTAYLPIIITKVHVYCDANFGESVATISNMKVQGLIWCLNCQSITPRVTILFRFSDDAKTPF